MDRCCDRDLRSIGHAERIRGGPHQLLVGCGGGVAVRRAELVWGFERGASFRQRMRLLRCQVDGIANTTRACLALDLRVDVLIRTDQTGTLIPPDELRKAVTRRSVMPDRERNLIAQGDRLCIVCELRDEKLTDNPSDGDREMQWYT